VLFVLRRRPAVAPPPDERGGHGAVRLAGAGVGPSHVARREEAMSSTQVRWESPGPGTWEFDASHQAAPYGRFTDELMLAPSERGTARGFRESGLPLETLAGAVINGWVYIQIKPVGGGGEGSPPPAFVFWLLFNLHPELRRRRKTARRFMAERGWEAVLASWFTSERPSYLARIHALQDKPPSELSDEELGQQLAKVTQ